jgi:DNA modification methylase
VSSLAASEPALSTAERLRDFFDRIDECTDKGYSTHALHPYPAKFIPHIPRELIQAYSQPGERVWDPMCGSGTAIVEAALAGRDALGGDLNPIAVLVSKAKTTPLEPGSAELLEALSTRLLKAAADTGNLPGEVPDFHNRDHWFEPQVSRELAYALTEIDLVEPPAARRLARCAFSAIVVAVSNQESETRWSAKRQEVRPGAALERLARRLSESVRRVADFTAAASGTARIRLEDARRSSVEAESVDLIVTSPPYANSHDYYLYNKLRMFWLGYEVAPVQEAEIGSRNRHSDRKEDVGSYLDAMESVFASMRRALVDGGRAVIVVADAVIRKELFKMDVLLAERARRAGLWHEETFGFDHRRFNSTFQRGFGTRREKETHVLVFQRR